MKRCKIRCTGGKHLTVERLSSRYDLRDPIYIWQKANLSVLDCRSHMLLQNACQSGQNIDWLLKSKLRSMASLRVSSACLSHECLRAAGHRQAA